MNAPKQHVTEHTERELNVSISQLINMNVGVNDANMLCFTRQLTALLSQFMWISEVVLFTNQFLLGLINNN